jgi:hypothetical protein
MSGAGQVAQQLEMEKCHYRGDEFDAAPSVGRDSMNPIRPVYGSKEWFRK